MTQNYDHLFKVILAGDTSVGKTNLVQQFSKTGMANQTNISPTIGVQFSTRIVELPNKKKIKTQIWDTAGQQQYRSITTAHYRKALGALVVYDITKQKTYQNVKKWIESIREQADPNIVIFLVGNKIDRKGQQQVNPADARKFANNQGIFFEETSALNNQNVEQTFMKLIQQIYKRMAERQARNDVPDRQGPVFKLPNYNQTKNSDKCQC